MSTFPAEHRPNRELILFRHAKSDWSSNAPNDHQRPLAERGIKAAKKMGKILARMGQTPDFILTSSAVRAHDTQKLASTNGHWAAPIGVTDSLYEASPSAVLTMIQEMPDQYRRVMLVGHETCWSQLTSRLIGGGQIRFPTAAMARIDFEVDSWSKVADGRGQLIWFLPPKHIKKAC